jgi:RimJ/RimL family protein N-acetyltransferase
VQRPRSFSAGNGSWIVWLASYRALWRRGIATEALSAFLRLEQTRPLHAGVATHNAASIRVLQKCGFTLLGPEEAAPGDAEASHVLLRLDV